MKTLKSQKRLAAYVLNVGTNRVWFDPEKLKEIKEAITKADIESLIKDGAISKKSVVGVKGRARRDKKLKSKKERGRGRGKKRMILINEKRVYMFKIRKLRQYIKVLNNAKIITTKEGNKLEKLAKAGIIKNKADIRARIKK